MRLMNMPKLILVYIFNLVYKYYIKGNISSHSKYMQSLKLNTVRTI